MDQADPSGGPMPVRAGLGSGCSQRPGKVLFLLDEDTRPVERFVTGRGIPKFTTPHCQGRRGAQERARLLRKNIMIMEEPCAQAAENWLGGLIPEPRPTTG